MLEGHKHESRTAWTNRLNLIGVVSCSCFESLSRCFTQGLGAAPRKITTRNGRSTPIRPGLSSQSSIVCEPRAATVDDLY